MRKFLVLALGALALAPTAAFAQEKVLHEERSLYRNIRVTQNGQERCMLFRARQWLGRQSCQIMDNPRKLVFDYTQMMLAGLYLKPAPKKDRKSTRLNSSHT